MSRLISSIGEFLLGNPIFWIILIVFLGIGLAYGWTTDNVKNNKK